MIGLLLSYWVNLPSVWAIVMVLSAVFVAAYLFGTALRRGPTPALEAKPFRAPNQRMTLISYPHWYYNRKVDRSTRQKRAVEAALRSHDNPLTPPEIHALALKEVPGIGLATVYRSLKLLAKDGRVVSVEIPGQPRRYELTDKGHHHHFLCRVCGEGIRARKMPRRYQENGATSL